MTDSNSPDQVQPETHQEQPDLQAQLDEALAQIAELKDQVLRAHAEAENVRRRSQEDVAKARKFGIESFAESLVPVRDSLEAALALENQTAEALREGVDVTLKQLSAAFDRNHLKQIAPAPGERFDPNLHQAISSVPSEHPANTVANTLQVGYLISDRVLRPALVMVSAG
ncbi:nucleotide exchange factor GrpE [Kerstersia similis]|uniref:nucleotide exchange factor GrpE n=1 Tax=Kerstersia similis TaxID=206505 RepID=UPI0039EF946A